MIVNAGSKYPTTGGTYGSITLERQRLVQPDPADHRDLRRDRDLPDARQHQGPHPQRQRLGDDRHDLRPGGPARRERQCRSSTRRSIVDTLTISGNGVANTVTLSSPAGTVAYTPAQIRDAYGINNAGAGRHRPDHRHRRRLRRPEHLPGPRCLRLPVRADRLRTDALQPVRAGIVVLDRPQPVRPGHVPALNRPERARHRQLGSRGSARRRMGPCHRPRRPDHPGRGQQPVAFRPDGQRGHRRQPARRVGGVDELGLRRRPGRLRQR